MSKKQNELFKIITVGNTGVGKTSIIKRYIYNIFEDNTLCTVGLDFLEKDITLKNQKEIKLKLVDTGGEERFRALSKTYFKNAEAVLFVFALNNQESFSEIQNWINLFHNAHNGNPNIPKFLVGNKCDLKEKNIEQNDIDNFAQNNNLKYIETSAKDNILITELFQEIGEILYKDFVESGKGHKSQKKNNIMLNKDKEKKNDGCCSIKTDLSYS